MRKLLLATILAYLAIPTIVGNVVLAQRQGDELGRVATGLCCLDVCVVPDFGPIGNTALGIIGLLFIVFLIWGAAADSAYKESQAKEKERRVKDTKENYEQWIHRQVTLLADSNFRGVVVHQDLDTLYINYLNQNGALIQITRKINEVRQVQNANDPPQAADPELRPPSVGEGDTGGH